MSTQLSPIKLWGQGGPNPPKVAIILQELSLPHEIINLPFNEVKGTKYTALNPNGRLPTIEDPNSDLTLWESGAIVEYLVDHYDKNHLISFPTGTREAYLAKQWSYFQASGQGPYFGQAVWFTKFHHEQLASAKERYNKEVNRVTGVLEGCLAQQEEQHGSGNGGPWLVGDKLSYADLSFVQWQLVIAMLLPSEEYSLDKFPQVKAWIEKMTAREPVKKALESMQRPE
jgi:glutathione S-transferase